MKTEMFCPGIARSAAASGHATASERPAVSSTTAAATSERRAHSSNRTAITAVASTITAPCHTVMCAGTLLDVVGPTTRARSLALAGRLCTTDCAACSDSRAWVDPAWPTSQTIAIAEWPSEPVPSGTVRGSDHQSRTEPMWRLSARSALTAAS